MCNKVTDTDIKSSGFKSNLVFFPAAAQKKQNNQLRQKNTYIFGDGTF